MAPIVILGALLTATGALTALLASGEHLNTAGQNYADYFVTRNLAMAAMLVVTLALRARRILAALMALTALIQLLDAATAATTARLGLIPIDIAFAAVFLLGAAQLSGLQLRRHSTGQRPPLPPGQAATSPTTRKAGASADLAEQCGTDETQRPAPVVAGLLLREGRRARRSGRWPEPGNRETRVAVFTEPCSRRAAGVDLTGKRAAGRVPVDVPVPGL